MGRHYGKYSQGAKLPREQKITARGYIGTLLVLSAGFAEETVGGGEENIGPGGTRPETPEMKPEGAVDLLAEAKKDH